MGFPLNAPLISRVVLFSVGYSLVPILLRNMSQQGCLTDWLTTPCFWCAGDGVYLETHWGYEAPTTLGEPVPTQVPCFKLKTPKNKFGLLLNIMNVPSLDYIMDPKFNFNIPQFWHLAI
jgi:hypothetical protein